MKAQSKEVKPPKVSLKEVKDFPKEGILFKDISPMLAKPKELRQVIRYCAEIWKGKIDIIGGFDARGFIFASLLAYEMKLPFFMLRKLGKLPGECHTVSYDLEYGSASLEMQQDAVQPGDKVLLVDDLLATGGTALAGCRLVELSGGIVTGLQFIIELKDLGGKDLLSRYEVHSVVEQ